MPERTRHVLGLVVLVVVMLAFAAALA